MGEMAMLAVVSPSSQGTLQNLIPFTALSLAMAYGANGRCCITRISVSFSNKPCCRCLWKKHKS